MPDGHMSPCLATRWNESEDGLTYDFELRQGVKFHNGDPFTAADVKFTYETIMRPETKTPRKSFYDKIRGAKAMADGNASEIEGIRTSAAIHP